MDNIKFGETIAKIRKEKNMTQKELAEKLNVTDKAVSKWERGASFPDISLLEPLSKILGIGMNELLTSEKDNNEINIENKAKELINEMNLKRKKKRNKILKKIMIILIIIVILMATVFISEMKFVTLNPFRALIGYIQIEKMGKDYVEVGAFPNKVIYAKEGVYLTEYMKEQGFIELKEEQMGYSRVFTNGKIRQYITCWGLIDGYPFQIWEWQGTSVVKEDEHLNILNEYSNDIINNEVQTCLEEIYINENKGKGEVNSI